MKLRQSCGSFAAVLRQLKVCGTSIFRKTGAAAKSKAACGLRQCGTHHPPFRVVGVAQLVQQSLNCGSSANPSVKVSETTE